MRFELYRWQAHDVDEGPCQTFDGFIGVRENVCGLFLFVRTHTPLMIRRQLHVIVPDASFLYESRKFYLRRHQRFARFVGGRYRHRHPFRCRHRPGDCRCERPQMLRRIEMIDLPAKRRLLHKYCAAASFFSSDESAKAQPAAQQEEEQHFTQHRQP